ncbi:hypothetical protein, partial [Shigella sonnei]
PPTLNINECVASAILFFTWAIDGRCICSIFNIVIKDSIRGIPLPKHRVAKHIERVNVPIFAKIRKDDIVTTEETVSYLLLIFNSFT